MTAEFKGKEIKRNSCLCFFFFLSCTLSHHSRVNEILLNQNTSVTY